MSDKDTEPNKKRYTIAQKKACAEHFGVSVPLVEKWVAYGWDITNYEEITKHREGDSESKALKLQKLEYETEWKKQQAEKVKLQVLKEKRELIPIGEVEELFTKLGVLVKTQLEKLEGELPPMVEGRPAKEVQPIVREKVKEVLGVISECKIDD